MAIHALLKLPNLMEGWNVSLRYWMMRRWTKASTGSGAITPRVWLAPQVFVVRVERSKCSVLGRQLSDMMTHFRFSSR
jgi:hypothetical protein